MTLIHRNGELPRRTFGRLFEGTLTLLPDAVQRYEQIAEMFRQCQCTKDSPFQANGIRLGVSFRNRL